MLIAEQHPGEHARLFGKQRCGNLGSFPNLESSIPHSCNSVMLTLPRRDGESREGKEGKDQSSSISKMPASPPFPACTFETTAQERSPPAQPTYTESSELDTVVILHGESKLRTHECLHTCNRNHAYMMRALFQHSYMGTERMSTIF